MHLRWVGRIRFQALPWLVCLACLLAGLGFPAAALADEVHVTASADPGLPQAPARQQALERAFAEAVHKGALALLPGPLPEARSAALRKFLTPRALDFVQGYHETKQDRPSPATPQGQAESQPASPSAIPAATQGAAQDKAVPLELELAVNVQRAALRQALVRLGFFAAGRHPGAYALRLGSGVKDKDTLPLEAEDVLLGLKRAPLTAPALPEVTLERLPQGYHKAVLRQGSVVLVADAPDVPGLWLEIWAKYFSDPRLQPGPGRLRLAVAGFASVDAVQEFLRLLSSWDDAVQEPSLAGMDLDGAGVSAQYICRVTSQERLDARLREVLPGRKLRLTGQAGVDAP